MRRASRAAKTCVFPIKKSTSRLHANSANQHLRHSIPPVLPTLNLYQQHADSAPAAMASIKQSFQKVLDSTALATTKFIRRPPIDPKTPIQGKPRQPSSNAYREHQDKEGRRLQKALNSLSHGQNIFVYQHLRTKQVVYSLTRYLEVSSTFLPNHLEYFDSGAHSDPHIPL